MLGIKIGMHRVQEGNDRTGIAVELLISKQYKETI